MIRIIILLFCLPCLLFGQSPLTNIKSPGNKRAKKCRKYYEVYRKLPVELRYSVKVVDRQIIFYFPSEEILYQIFDKKYDGIAIDVLSRDQFDCKSGFRFAGSWAHNGQLLEPIFRDELQSRMVIDEELNAIVHYGELPARFDPLEVECNLLLIQKRFLCGYHSFSHVEYSQWDLLQMGLFRDSIPEITRKESALAKELMFEIQFAKNKHSFDSADIQPLYDTLNFTNFRIQSIDVMAFTSIEGDSVSNLQLQSERVVSILDALQDYQSEEIRFTSESHENWEGFLKDIRNTSYEYLLNYERDQIRQELEDLQDHQAMESILQSHRKALVTMRMERRFEFAENPEALIQLFGETIERREIEEAIYIQEQVFREIENSRLPEEFLNQIEIPLLAEYSPLVNNRLIFEYENSLGLTSDHIATFQELKELLGDNPRIDYNLTALKLRASTMSTFPRYREEIDRTIRVLYGRLDRSLVRRLEMNYHLLNTTFLHNRGVYRERNKSLRKIYSTYRTMDLSDLECLHLARFLSIFSQFNWAEDILEARVYQQDAIPELIDYYLRLTISDPRKFKRRDYQDLLTRILKDENKVFCDLFLPAEQGGFTFQLLWKKELADLYCQNCREEGNDL